MLYTPLAPFVEADVEDAEAGMGWPPHRLPCCRLYVVVVVALLVVDVVHPVLMLQSSDPDVSPGSDESAVSVSAVSPPPWQVLTPSGESPSRSKVVLLEPPSPRPLVFALSRFALSHFVRSSYLCTGDVRGGDRLDDI